METSRLGLALTPGIESELILYEYLKNSMVITFQRTEKRTDELHLYIRPSCEGIDLGIRIVNTDEQPASHLALL